LRFADEFNDICEMLNCIGSTDEKHCRIKCPSNAVFYYLNFKSLHSTNLLSVADTNCCFALIDVEAHGCENESSGFSNPSFGKAFIAGDLNVPLTRNIQGTSTRITFYFVREEAFPLKPNLMRPFHGETSISQNPYSMANFVVQREK
jgi:hypothetical protein